MTESDFRLTQHIKTSHKTKNMDTNETFTLWRTFIGSIERKHCDISGLETSFHRWQKLTSIWWRWCKTSELLRTAGPETSRSQGSSSLHFPETKESGMFSQYRNKLVLYKLKETFITNLFYFSNCNKQYFSLKTEIDRLTFWSTYWSSITENIC